MSVIINKLDSIQLLGVLGTGHFGIVLKFKFTSINLNDSGRIDQKFGALKFEKQTETDEEIIKEYTIWRNAQQKLRRTLPKTQQILTSKILGLFKFDYENKTRLGVGMKFYESTLTELVKSSFNIKNVVSDMIQGVSQLHSCGIIHGDIAKRNFLVDKKRRVIITDFGLAHKTSRKLKDSSMYSENYSDVYSLEQPGIQPIFSLAPEVLRSVMKSSPLSLTFSSDVYMLGLAVLELLQADTFVPFKSDKTVMNGAVQYPGLFLEKMQSVNIAMPKPYSEFSHFPLIQEIILQSTHPECDKRVKKAQYLVSLIDKVDLDLNVEFDVEEDYLKNAENLLEFESSTNLCYGGIISNKPSLKLQLSQGIDLNSSGYDEFESSYSPRDVPATPTKITRSQSQKSPKKSIFRRMRRQTDRF